MNIVTQDKSFSYQYIGLLDIENIIMPQLQILYDQSRICKQNVTIYYCDIYITFRTPTMPVSKTFILRKTLNNIWYTDKNEDNMNYLEKGIYMAVTPKSSKINLRNLFNPKTYIGPNEVKEDFFHKKERDKSFQLNNRRIFIEGLDINCYYIISDEIPFYNTLLKSLIIGLYYNICANIFTYIAMHIILFFIK